MTPQEIEHQEWKNQLRQEALEKEVDRLKKIKDINHEKIKKLKKSALYLLVFFVILLTSFFYTGVLSFKSKSGANSISTIHTLTDSTEKLSDSILILNQAIEHFHNSQMHNRDEAGYKYRIQIGAFKELNLNDFSENLVTISQEKYDSINQYTLGSFTNYDKAHEFLERVKKMGFKDSFIIATHNGKRISVKEALKNQEGN